MISRRISFIQDAENQIRVLFADDEVIDRGVEWAQSVLETADVDPSRRPGRAARVLRAHEPSLTRATARYLVERAAGRVPKRVKETFGRRLLL